MTINNKETEKSIKRDRKKNKSNRQGNTPFKKEEVERRNNLKLNRIQEEIITGHMLGDGCIVKPFRNSVFKLRRSYNDFEYLDWTYNNFKNLSTNGIIISDNYNKIYKKMHKACAFQTMALNCLNKYREKWYPNGIKIVPRDLKLTPLILAIWVADDGCIKKYSNSSLIEFATQSFIYEDVIFLKKMLENFVGEEFNIYKLNEKICVIKKDQYMISGSSKACNKVLEIIKPYLINIKMERKIPKDIKYKNSFRDRMFNLLNYIKNNKDYTIDDLLKNTNYKIKDSIHKRIRIFVREGLLSIDKKYDHNKKTYILTEKGLKSLQDDSFYKQFYTQRKRV